MGGGLLLVPRKLEGRVFGVHRAVAVRHPSTLPSSVCPAPPHSPAALRPGPALCPCEQKCEDRFAKSKLVHSIMRHVAETTGCNLEQLYTEVRRGGLLGGWQCNCSSVVTASGWLETSGPLWGTMQWPCLWTGSS